MDFIEKSVASFDLVNGSFSQKYSFILTDTYFSTSPQGILFTFNTPFNELHVDAVYTYNSSYLNNKSMYPKLYTFNAEYNSYESILSKTIFSSKYKFSYLVSGDLPYKNWTISFNSHDPQDGIFNFDCNYNYVIDESIFVFSSTYAFRNSDDHISFSNPFIPWANNTTSYYVQLEEDDGLINFEELFKYAIFNNNSNNNLLAYNNVDSTIVPIEALGKYLFENNKVIGLTINNGSRYNNTTIPIMWDNLFNEFAMPPLYSSSVHIDDSKILMNGNDFINVGKYKLSSFEAKSTIEFQVPSFIILNIDPYRPVSVKLSIMELNKNDNLYIYV